MRVRATKRKGTLPGQTLALAGGPRLLFKDKDQGCHDHAMPCHVRPGPTPPPRRDAADCRANGGWTGGLRSNSAIIHLMLSHTSQSRRQDEIHTLIPAHSSSNIREPVSQSASHPRSFPFPILPTFRPSQPSPAQTSQTSPPSPSPSTQLAQQ